VDIVLFDPFGPARRGDLHSDLAQLSCEGTAKVVAFSWNRKPERIALALNFGAAGYLAKSLSPDEIVAALERVKADETVVEPPDLMPIDAGGSSPAHPWGLSPREAQVIALVARGLTNQQIADHVHLSINSIKTHTKNAYRKIGMSRRSQVVAWALAHGLTAPEISGAPGHIGVGGASHRIH
jgi:DNA-binding NarL/FixJ family response regulator